MQHVYKYYVRVGNIYLRAAFDSREDALKELNSSGLKGNRWIEKTGWCRQCGGIVHTDGSCSCTTSI